jgi:hypothetical protein
MHCDRKEESPAKAAARPPEEAVVRRRNRMAALWAAELLGLIGQAAHDYARELVGAHDHLPDEEHVVGRLSRDLKGVVTAHEIREKLSHLWHEARRQLLRETKPPGGA